MPYISMYHTLHMPHLSKYKLSKKAEEELIKNLELALAKLTKEEEMKGFLLSFLTQTERLMLAKRLAIAVLLKENLPVSHIATTLHVTRETVSRIQLILEARGEGYESALLKLKNEKIFQEFKTTLMILVKYAISASSGKLKTKEFYKLVGG